MSSINEKKGILTVNIHIRKRILGVAIATLGATPLFAYAQAHDAHSGHTAMPTSSAPADAASMSGMDHSKMNMSDMNHSTMIKSGQDHGAMNMMSDRKSARQTSSH